MRPMRDTNGPLGAHDENQSDEKVPTVGTTPSEMVRSINGGFTA